MNLDNLQNWLIPFSAVVVTILYSFSKFRQMNSEQAGELIKTLKEEVLVQKERNVRLTEENRTLKDSYQLQINELNKQIGELSGRMGELSKQNETLTKILQGRSPDQEKFMKYLTDSADNTLATLKEIQTFMKDLHERNKRVDKGGEKT